MIVWPRVSAEVVLHCFEPALVQLRLQVLGMHLSKFLVVCELCKSPQSKAELV